MSAQKRSKTVYVLGAGFSRPAEAPLQAEILREIFALRTTYQGDHVREVARALDAFQEFLENGLAIDPADFPEVMLEDVFTPIDRCLADGVSFRKYDVRQLVQLREQVFSLILFAFQNRIGGQGTTAPYLERFARSMVAQMRPRMQDPDHEPVSILSTNWDSLLDIAIQRELKRHSECGVLDYCCYIEPLDDEDQDTLMPGLWALGRGGYNVKLLKLHGSMNWLQCPKCQRLYAAFDPAAPEHGIFRRHQCRHCAVPAGGRSQDDCSAALKSTLIMPTFLKDLTNFQLKLVWQNAAIELSEASKVVFIGYSLPPADYELRQLYARTIPLDAEIEVVQNEETGDAVREENAAAFRRYRSFFGRRKITLQPIGVEEFTNRIPSK
jgi:hypothetical protein